MNKNISLIDFPKLIKVEILLFLDVQSLGRFFRTCKTLNPLSNEDSVWKTITLSKIKTIKEKEKEKEGNWKDLFKNSHLMGFWQDTYTFCQKETQMIEKASKIFRKETFPRNSISSFDDKPNSWTCFLSPMYLSSDLNWVTVINKTEVKHSIVTFDVLITRNDDTYTPLCIGAINEPFYSKEMHSGYLKDHIGKTKNSIGIFSGYSGFCCEDNYNGGFKQVTFAKGDLISLEIDPFKQEFQYYYNKKPHGNRIKWKNLLGEWNKDSKIHPAVSMGSEGRVEAALRVSF